MVIPPVVTPGTAAVNPVWSLGNRDVKIAVQLFDVPDSLVIPLGTIDIDYPDHSPRLGPAQDHRTGRVRQTDPARLGDLLRGKLGDDWPGLRGRPREETDDDKRNDQEKCATYLRKAATPRTHSFPSDAAASFLRISQ
jgi:hypothetical protein